MIAHLSDTRSKRDVCRNRVLSGEFPQLAMEVVVKLDELDKIARREARRDGRSHPKAFGQARGADGKAVGHVRK